MGKITIGFTIEYIDYANLATIDSELATLLNGLVASVKVKNYTEQNNLVNNIGRYQLSIEISEIAQDQLGIIQTGLTAFADGKNILISEFTYQEDR